MRFSDLINLTTEDFDFEQELIRVHVVKTKEPLLIPITEKLKSVLDNQLMILKYKITNAKYNQYVKELCKNIGIDTPIKIVRYSGKEE